MDNEDLRNGVKKAYSKVAEEPDSKHPFPVGRKFAKSVGYPKKVLNELPDEVVDSFTGVSNVSVFADIPDGSTVVDIGCGVGLDSLIASEKTGPTGRVIGVDYCEEMIKHALQNLDKAKYGNLEFHIADAMELPFKDSEVDIVMINGLFNLNPSPFRKKIFHEIARILRTGGSVFASEIILRKRLEDKIVCDATNWFR